MRRHTIDPLNTPNYGYQEAVRYLHIPNSTLHYWLRPSLHLIKPAGRNLLSFNNMRELYVLKGLEDVHGVEMKQIRRAVDYIREEFNVERPLIEFELKTDGAFVIIEYRGEYTNMSLRGQKGMGPILDSYLRRVDRDFIFPFMRREHIVQEVTAPHPQVVVMRPNICVGKPVLVNSRITTQVLASRFLGGDSYPVLAASYDRSVAEIQEAVEWEIGEQEKAA